MAAKCGWLASCALLCLAAICAGPLVSESEREAARQVSQGTWGGSPGLKLLGQFRTSLAETIWAKTEEYLHNGIGKGLDEPGSNCGGQHDEGHDHPRHNDDWKGPLGELEREMRPWADHHLEHAPTEELLPWFRVIAWCNPHFVQVYVDGAYILSWESKRPQEAVEFLRQGLRLNPEAIQLYTALGDLYLYNVKKGREAYPYYVAAYEIGRRLKNPSEDEKLAYRDAFRGLVFVYRQFGNKRWERRLATEGLEHFPGDKVLAEVH